VLVCCLEKTSDDAGKIEELGELARACHLNPVAFLTTTRRKPDPAHYIGGGKLAELRELCDRKSATTVVFGHDLSAAQTRNLERALERKVTDRVTLIVEIFARRARSSEGKLQVEIARARVELSKLAGYWTHLERQRGGLGAVGGPGEKQIEIDRRIIKKRISRLNGQIGKRMNQTRMTKRRRQRRGIPTVALVGYTNAGKSTLLNALTGSSDAVASGRMFETLDSLSRKIRLGGGREVVVTDTVGFLRNLPHELVAAFQATLSETADADLLLHVVDASSPDAEQQIRAVENALDNGVGGSGTPRLLVWNKCDCSRMKPQARKDQYGRIKDISISALKGDGLDCLRDALEETLASIQPSTSLG